MGERALLVLIALETLLAVVLVVLLVGILTGAILGPSEGLMQIEVKVDEGLMPEEPKWQDVWA